MSNTSYPQQHFTSSVLTLHNSNFTHLPRNDLHKWFTAKPGLKHIAIKGRFLYFLQSYDFWEKNRLMSISENMQRMLSIFKHEAQLLSFFPLICMSKWYTLHHFDVKGWYRFMRASLLFSNIVTPVWIYTGVPTWSLSFSFYSCL